MHMRMNAEPINPAPPVTRIVMSYFFCVSQS
jgi:hypothetical protein